MYAWSVLKAKQKIENIILVFVKKLFSDTMKENGKEAGSEIQLDKDTKNILLMPDF